MRNSVPSRTICSCISCVKGTSKTPRVVCTRVNTWIWFSRVPDSLRIWSRPFLNNHLLYQHLPDISNPLATFHLNKTRLCEQAHGATWRLTPTPQQSSLAAMTAVCSAAPLHTQQPVANMQMCWVNSRLYWWLHVNSLCLNVIFV